MGAANTLSTVNVHTVQRQSSSSTASVVQSNAGLSFPCQSVQKQGEHHQDSARLHSDSNCGDSKQSRAEFLYAKDASRRKRANRTAKLKQYKLDARREQWLSQGSQGKQGNAELQQQSSQQQHRNCEHQHKAGDGDFRAQDRAGPSGHTRSQVEVSSESTSGQIPAGSPATPSRPSSCGLGNEAKNSKKEVSSRRLDSSSRAPQFFGDGESQVGDEHKQDSANNGRSVSDVSKSRSTSSCASSSYTGSGSEDNGGSHDAEDDWESAFDALHVQSSPHRSDDPHKGPSSDRAQLNEGKELQDKKHVGAHYNLHHSDMQSGQLKPEYKYKNSGFGGRRGNGGRAWRPDDVARPPTLPRLAKQHSYPNHSSNNSYQGWGNMHGNLWADELATPSSCPICTEELDVTDSSYIPCTCGFQLCLFCYHRISSDDGRCPGCRKAYNPDSAVKLSRSSSVWLRV